MRPSSAARSISANPPSSRNDQRALSTRQPDDGVLGTLFAVSRFWAALAAALPDVRAVSALGKRAGLVCRTSDGRGSVTVGP
jgi:hypothetical protein